MASGHIEGIDQTESVDESRIASKPGVCGGCPVIAGTRIPVWGIAELIDLRYMDSQILEAHPALSQEDLNAAREYIAQNRDEIDRQIRENAEA